MCSVAVNIRAKPESIWSLLTDAEGFPRWNSTVTRIEGDIREGERLRLSVPGTNRTFTPRVSGVVPNERMTWTGGFNPLFKGVRTFKLKLCSDGSTDFVMQEHSPRADVADGEGFITRLRAGVCALRERFEKCRARRSPLRMMAFSDNDGFLWGRASLHARVNDMRFVEFHAGRVFHN